MSVAETAVVDRVARVVLDRPPLNIVDLGAAKALAAALERVKRERGLVAVVLESRGRAFCAGVDVRDHLPDRGAEMLHEFHRVCGLLLELEPPVMAVVQGAALGGGCELTMVCDLVWAAEGARFGVPEIKLGVFPPVAAVALARLVGARRASELVLTGRIIDAAEAQRIGLVNRVVPDRELPAAVEALLAELRALSPAALRSARRALRLGRAHPEIAEIGNAERLYTDERLEAPDAVEGLQAFIEKRAPVWADR